MPNQYTNQPGAAVKLNQIRKANIQATNYKTGFFNFYYTLVFNNLDD